MRNSQTSSLLVAALVMLRHPCNRNKAAAQLLLERAAEHAELTPAERDACLTLADDLESERPEATGTRVRPAPRPVIDRGQVRRLSLESGQPLAHGTKAFIP
ncbi:MAG TPA: hypothetical protein PLE48_05690 [Thiobacillus sp.]|nr:MAG: hypothetical protein B7Y50_05125 [Hydrogenophilales bacterium 28-61-11]OYZ57795.1 MAG: hypothetical protein B7Y21_06190 [Hydrogenophilales bacterium 16-61-112]OZA48625.1 MAG: hypothetical protein B7X81_03565 [Hydrogenophilales bacterium 17-61-76]HQT32027.1 hypothetical protein [Thiobacillus sp.]HQT69893.1 hypothetical protein [Thiobacillus sp.]